MSRPADISNGTVRELVAERDYLKGRNISLSDSLDAYGAQVEAMQANVDRLVSVLNQLGFDQEGKPLPKEPSVVEYAPIGEPADGDPATVDE